MRHVALVFIGLAACAGARPAFAADAPAIVIPGKAGVPVVINGSEVSYCVVEGDYGLDRPGQAPITIVACPPIAVQPGYDRGYYPAFGRRPGYGRYEIVPPPNRRLPPPAQDYYREWGTQSEMLPPTVYPPGNIEIYGAPQDDRRADVHGEQRRDPHRDNHGDRRHHVTGHH